MKVKNVDNKIEELKMKAKNVGIGNYNSVIARIVSGSVGEGDICYVASTPYYNYGGFLGKTTRAYKYEDGDFQLIFSNLKNHRAKIALKNYKKYIAGEIDPIIWENYIHNGYNTRRGLLRSIKTNQMIKISQSHVTHLGYGLEEDHEIRVLLRN